MLDIVKWLEKVEAASTPEQQKIRDKTVRMLIKNQIAYLGSMMMSQWFTATVTHDYEPWMDEINWDFFQQHLAHSSPMWVCYSHRAITALLRNPQVKPEIWQTWCWINPNAALQNPALTLFMLEDAAFFGKIPGYALRCIISSPYFPEDIKKAFLADPTLRMLIGDFL